MEQQSKITTYEGSTESFTFTLEHSCSGETILADLYVIGEEDYTARVSDSVSGGLKGVSKTIPLNFSGVSQGGYGLKVWTELTGVLTKTIVIIK